MMSTIWLEKCRGIWKNIINKGCINLEHEIKNKCYWKEFSTQWHRQCDRRPRGSGASWVKVSTKVLSTNICCEFFRTEFVFSGRREYSESPFWDLGTTSLILTEGGTGCLHHWMNIIEQGFPNFLPWKNP